MIVDLDNVALVALVRGVRPNDSILNDEDILNNGSQDFIRWEWNTDSLKKLSDEKLYEIFLKCRKSFNV